MAARTRDWRDRGLRHPDELLLRDDARIGSDLGYDVWFVLDATHTFDIAAADGEVVPAAAIARMTAINLQDEFAEVVTTTAACA
jgi:nicotinamidase-related amidase